MAFLDNSGDIILDAVLTDTGRMRLARGDGSFKITKFALGDDEINYSSFNANHPSGSAYYDLEVLQTPILEAFTNNSATMKSKLISLSNTNLLYLPVMVLNEHINANLNHKRNVTTTLGTGSFVVLVDDDTLTSYNDTNPTTDWGTGLINGVSAKDAPNGFIRVDQGLNTTEISSEFELDTSLKELDFIIRMDHRLGLLRTASATGGTQPTHSHLDDDNIATYFVSNTSGVGASMVTPLPPGKNGTGVTGQVINGPRGNKLEFKIGASTQLNSSDFLFQQVGSTITHAGVDFYFIDTTVQVEGANTGYRLDIPIRYIKKQ